METQHSIRNASTTDVSRVSTLQQTVHTDAGYYVIAVVSVYSMSIILLLASGIRRRPNKRMEDREIDKYLREFQVGLGSDHILRSEVWERLA